MKSDQNIRGEKKETYHETALTVKNEDDQWCVSETIRKQHKEQHSKEGRTDEFQEVDSRPQRAIWGVGALAFGHVDSKASGKR
jgi:hypothetical protein